MSADQNPQNFEGATVTIVGRVGAAPEFPPYDKEGTRGFGQIRVAVGMGYKNKQTGEWVDQGTMWFTVTAPMDHFNGIGKGDKIRLDDARLEAREFTRKDGSTGQAFETRFGDITVLESKQGASDDGDPF